LEQSANLSLAEWRQQPALVARDSDGRMLAGIVIACACLSALMASWLPLQFSIVTVFLFAGPHNWFELRYFLMRLPVRFGRSRNFFLTAFAGIGVLTAAYVSMPIIYGFGGFSDRTWPTMLASWNSLLLLWLGLLVWQRGKQKARRDWSWAFPLALGLCSLNWLAPEFFSLGIVYCHPLVALWFMDRHLARTRPQWLGAYRRCLGLLPLLLAAIFWQLGHAAALPDDNGLFCRITQHAGAQLLPNISSRALVGTHVFLEMLHYGVWLFALPLIAPAPKRGQGRTTAARKRGASWNLRAVPVARHPHGFPKLVATALIIGLFLVLVLWFGFAIDYATTRDIYFTLAIAHVLAEAPFLLRMI
jgi:hypothetical protein